MEAEIMALLVYLLQFILSKKGIGTSLYIPKFISPKSGKKGLTDKHICLAGIPIGLNYSENATALYNSSWNNLWSTRDE